MNSRSYILVSASIFALVTMGHLIRIVTDAALMFGTWSLPMLASWIGLLMAASLSGWGFSLTRHRDRTQ